MPHLAQTGRDECRLCLVYGLSRCTVRCPVGHAHDGAAASAKRDRATYILRYACTAVGVASVEYCAARGGLYSLVFASYIVPILLTPSRPRR
eukprot:4269247-Prymnesium_polylepis.1